MRIRVLGSGAGGGVPQWNSRSLACRLAREGDPRSPVRTQTSLAVSADGERWALLDASPDVREQLARAPALHPRSGAGPRSSPIAAVVLTGAEIDRIAGLLTLRERQPLALYATTATRQVLDESRVFEALPRDVVPRRELPLDRRIALADAAGAPLGLEVEAFAVPGKEPLFEEGRARGEGARAELSIGLRVSAGARAFFYVPGCAAVPPALADCLRGAELLFFDGTLFTDDELLTQGAGTKTGARMGHVALSGPGGSLRALSGLGVARTLLVHLNNTNPALVEGTPERREVEAAGLEVAFDGQEITL